MQKKEKIKTIVIIVLALIIVLGGSFLVSEFSGKAGKYNDSTANPTDTNTSQITEEEIPESEQGDLVSITIDQYLSYKEGEEKKIILIGRPTCHYCQLFNPIIRNVVYLYGLEVNYLNTDELTDEGQAKLVSSDDYFNGNWGTPLTLIVQKDEIVDMIEGYSSKEATIQFFKDNGFITE